MKSVRPFRLERVQRADVESITCCRAVTRRCCRPGTVKSSGMRSSASGARWGSTWCPRSRWSTTASGAASSSWWTTRPSQSRACSTTQGQGELWEEQARYGYQTGIAMALHLPEGKHFMLGVDRDRALPSDRHELTRVVADLQLFAVHALDAAM